MEIDPSQIKHEPGMIITPEIVNMMTTGHMGKFNSIVDYTPLRFLQHMDEAYLKKLICFSTLPLQICITLIRAMIQ